MSRRTQPAIRHFPVECSGDDERFEGRYTALARRAGIPVSTMQHYVHAAKHLPGGEHLMRMEAALGVTVEGLVGGPAAGRPAAEPAPRAPVVFTRAQTPPRGIATHVALPVFRWGCPGPCPLTEVVPPVAAMQSKVVLAAALLARTRNAGTKWIAANGGVGY